MPRAKLIQNINREFTGINRASFCGTVSAKPLSEREAKLRDLVPRIWQNKQGDYYELPYTSMCQRINYP
jgi:hypothetical protein